MDIEIIDDDYVIMRKAFDEAANCKASDRAFSVGSILTTVNREIVSVGYSREFGSNWHAEEVAIKKAVRRTESLDKCILYSTLEPCGERKSRPVSCSELVLKENIPVVIFAESEPNSFVATPKGRLLLEANGVQLFKLDGFKGQFEHQNSHINLVGSLLSEFA